MAGGIFISYRHNKEARHVAGRLAGDLADHFGTGKLFRDIEQIEPGIDFTVALNKALGACQVMLVLIDERWLVDDKGERRMDNPRDWVRLEVATALQRDIRVVPVLIEDAKLPAEEQLPGDLKPLVLRQALPLSDSRWPGDLRRVIETLERLPGLAPDARASVTRAPSAAPAAAPASRRGPLLAGIAIGVVGLLALAAYFGSSEPTAPAQVPGDATAPTSAAAPVAATNEPALVQPVAAPAAQPAIRSLRDTPEPAAPPPARAALNVSGMWRSADGVETYRMQQQGNQVQIAAFAQGVPIGQGNASIDGNELDMQMDISLQGNHIANLDCLVQASGDGRSLQGMCSGGGGTFPIHFLR